jgi:hypothetical protein
MKMKDKRINVWLLAALIIFGGALSHTQAADESEYLSQEQLTQIPKLIKRVHAASENDKKRAEELLSVADEYRTANKWGIAAKAYTAN